MLCGSLSIGSPSPSIITSVSPVASSTTSSVDVSSLMEKREDLMMPFDPEVPVIIGCPDHGDFYITPNDHAGKNPERIAYGCPDCNADVDLSEVERLQPKYNELKAEEWEDTDAD